MVLTIMIEILNLKLVIMLEYEGTKLFFGKSCTSNWFKKVFEINEIKNTVP